jgi:hypothetical protein
MSTLSVGTIKSGTASTPPTIQDSNGTEIGTFCRAWVNFNGTGTVAIRAQFNVSSITDNGNGDYTVNFTTAMPDANYGVISGLITNAINDTANMNLLASSRSSAPTTKTTTAVRIGTFSDTDDASLAIFR